MARNSPPTPSSSARHRADRCPRRADSAALAKAKEKAQSISCVNNLKQMGLAARLYATDHNDAYPPDILSMKNELITPKT